MIEKLIEKNMHGDLENPEYKTNLDDTKNIESKEYVKTYFEDLLEVYENNITLNEYSLEKKLRYLILWEKNILAKGEQFFNKIYNGVNSSFINLFYSEGILDYKLLSSEDIEKSFLNYGDNVVGLFEWMRRIDMEEYFDYGIKERYNIDLGKTNFQTGLSTSIAYKISDKYFSVCDLETNDSRFYELNEEVEKKKKNEVEQFGNIKDDHLEFLVNTYNESNLEEFSKRILQFYPVLNQELKNKIEKMSGNVVFKSKKILSNTLFTKFEFDEIIGIEDNENLDFDTNQIKDIYNFLLLQKEKKFIYKKESEFNEKRLKNLNFFLNRCLQGNRVNDIVGEKHHSVLYYFYIRNKLPQNIRNDFEKHFNLKLPLELEDLNYAEFLEMNDEEILSVLIAEGKNNIEDITSWLRDRITSLVKDIEISKKSPVEVNLDKIVASNTIFIDSEIKNQYFKLLNPKIKYLFEQEIGVSINELNVQTQVYLLSFLNQDDTLFLEKVIGFINTDYDKENKINRLKSFLSTYGDLGFGENILSIAETQNVNVSNLIFEKYATLVDSVDKIEERLREEFGQEADVSEAVKAISDKLLFEGKELLKEWGKKEEKIDFEEAQEILEKIDANLKLQGNIYKYLKGCGVECLNESLSLNLEKIDALNIPLEDRNKMEEIYRSNYSEYNEFQELLINGFRKRFSEDRNVDFYILENKKTDNKEIGGFLSFEQKDENTLEMASVNLSQLYQGYGMGDDMIFGPIFELQKNFIIEAQALKDSPVLEKYLSMGFEVKEGTEKTINIDGKELVIVDIVLDKREREKED